MSLNAFKCAGRVVCSDNLFLVLCDQPWQTLLPSVLSEEFAFIVNGELDVNACEFKLVELLLKIFISEAMNHSLTLQTQYTLSKSI